MSLWGAMEANQAALRLHELELRLHVDDASTSTRLGPPDHHADASPEDGAIVHYAASKCRRWKDVIPAHDSDVVVVPELRLVYVDNVKVGSTTIRNALATVGYTWFIKRECARPIRPHATDRWVFLGRGSCATAVQALTKMTLPGAGGDGAVCLHLQITRTRIGTRPPGRIRPSRIALRVASRTTAT